MIAIHDALYQHSYGEYPCLTAWTPHTHLNLCFDNGIRCSCWSLKPDRCYDVLDSYTSAINTCIHNACWAVVPLTYEPWHVGYDPLTHTPTLLHTNGVPPTASACPACGCHIVISTMSEGLRDTLALRANPVFKKHSVCCRRRLSRTEFLTVG